MTHEEYKQQLAAWAGLTEKRLAALCDEYLPQQSELGQAARYSLLGGGKRVRAVLTLASCPAGRCRRCPMRWTMPVRWKCCTATRSFTMICPAWTTMISAAAPELP